METRGLSFAEDLLSHALSLLSEQDPFFPEDVVLRRAISAAYYALFHKINGDAVALLAPHVPVEVNHRIQRWFDHAEIRRICGRFVAKTLGQPLSDLIGPTASPDLKLVAEAFIQQQQARHSADYDLGYTVTWDDAQLLIERAHHAIEAWARLARTAEANIFILSLLLWKNWDKDRA